MRIFGRIALASGLAGAVVVAAVALPGAAAAGHGRRPVLGCFHGQHAFRPARVDFCGDGSFYLNRMRWGKWRRHLATGHGIGHANDCLPDCAHGTFRRAPIRVVLSKPRFCSQDRRLHFTRLRYRWSHGTPGGEGPKRGSIGFPCSLLGPARQFVDHLFTP